MLGNTGRTTRALTQSTGQRQLLEEVGNCLIPTAGFMASAVPAILKHKRAVYAKENDLSRCIVGTIKLKFYLPALSLHRAGLSNHSQKSGLENTEKCEKHWILGTV